MKLCPICATSYTAEHRTCPTHGTILVETQELPAGTMIRDCYRIVRMLGKGGMGTVYLAEHTLMGELRALKFLSADLAANPSFVQRFLQEARAANKLRHPNVAQTMELGQTEDGSFYISMEYVDGPSLRSALSHAPEGLELDRAFHIIRGVASGLGAAHAKRMVHRDIKPENILLANTAEGEVAKVVDFGIVAMSDGTGRLTQTGSVLLTCEYAAPEQWRGSIPSSELDGRTDLYAMGCMFFEMLTGRLPFKSDSYEGWFELHVRTAPPLPSSIRRELGEYPGLDALVLKLLAKEREDRPAHVGEFLADLDRVLGGTPPVQALQPASATDQTQRMRTVESPGVSGGYGQTAAAQPASATAPGFGAAPAWGTAPAPAYAPPAGHGSGETPAQFTGAAATPWQTQPPAQSPWQNQVQPPAPGVPPPQAYTQPNQPQATMNPGAQFAPGPYPPAPPGQYGGPYVAHPGVTAVPPTRRSNTGLIVGLILGCVVILGAAGTAAVLYLRKSMSPAQSAAQNPVQTQSLPQTAPATAPIGSEATTAPPPIPQPATAAPTEPANSIPRKPQTPKPDSASSAQQGLDLYNNKQYSEAQPLLLAACNKGKADSCNYLGVMYQLKLGVDQDYSQAVALFTKACNGGSMLGCNNLANLYQHKLGVDEDFPRALSLYQKACDGGEPSACNNLGVMYRVGQGVTQDNTRAAALYLKACDGGNPAGCSDLGILYVKGSGVAKDIDKARLYFNKGCSGGNKFGCDQLKLLN